MPPIGKEGTSAALDLQLLWAYQLAAELEGALGMAAYAVQYKSAAAQLAQTIRRNYWNGTKGLFADTPEKETYSQHVNALAILTGLVQGTAATALAQKLHSDTALTQATIYFQYYVHQALVKAGLGNDYLNWLDVWKENLAQGLTTWAEISDINNARSDCHAWGSHPNIEFFRTVLGIDSDAPGFRTVKIEPHLGTLKKVQGEMPHPSGTIAVAYTQEENKLKAVITLPQQTGGYLLWKGKRHQLKAGTTTTLTL
jgi:alpha-L-rhamnosidase